jgi:hypothetical protein
MLFCSFSAAKTYLKSDHFNGGGSLFVQAARAVLLRPQNWEKHGLKSWIEAAARRLNRFKLAIALANKIARIVWGVLHGGRNFEIRPMKPASQAA